MGHAFVPDGGLGDFTVTKSNPGGGNVVRFTISDSIGQLTSAKMIRAVLCDAIQQWIDAERADLDTNGDSDVTGADTRHQGDGFGAFDFNFGGKYAEVTLTAKTSISVSGDITVSKPYADTI